jgi:gas vesicle structural protein
VIRTSTNGSSLAEVLDRILDKGIVIDAFVRVSLVGIELLAIEARVVIASVERWLEYAEAVGLTRRHSGSFSGSGSGSGSGSVSDES